MSNVFRMNLYHKLGNYNQMYKCSNIQRCFHPIMIDDVFYTNDIQNQHRRNGQQTTLHLKIKGN